MLVSELESINISQFDQLSQSHVRTAKSLVEQSEEIYDRSGGALAENWKDKYAAGARDELEREARSCEILAMKARGSVSVLDGFTAAMRTQQRELQLTVAEARARAFHVNDDGTVRAYDPTKQAEADRFTPLIRTILADAARIDQEAAAQLKQLDQHGVDVDKDGDVDGDDVNKMRNEVLDAPAQASLDLMKQSMPLNASKEEQHKWWTSLTEEQREQFKRALPLEVYNMAGVPDDVKRDLAGSDGYNRMKLVQYALDNAYNKDLDYFDNNCTHFVSSALEAAGLDSKGWLTIQEDAWGHNLISQFDTPMRTWGPSHTDSWVNAEASQNFFTRNGAEVVAPGNVRPGDIIYWEQDGHNPEIDKGMSHHAAIVTAVTPNGDILYTQHTSSQDNVSLNARQPYNNIREGDQKIVILRPKETW